MDGWVQQALKNPLAGKLVRFAVTGALSGLVFGLVTLLSIKFFKISPALATLIGYGAVLPLSFMGHRKVTFRSNGKLAPEFWRFCLSFGAGLCASVLAMHFVTNGLEMAPVYGVVLAILIVPVITFIIMNSWVFPDEAERG